VVLGRRGLRDEFCLGEEPFGRLPGIDENLSDVISAGLSADVVFAGPEVAYDFEDGVEFGLLGIHIISLRFSCNSIIRR
jgi:hypothetical protein